MMASRSLDDLQPAMHTKMNALIGSLKQASTDVLFYCTLRTFEEQAILFRNGRSLADIQAKADELSHEYQRPDLAEILLDVGPQNGKKIVTWAAPGQSMHNYGYAVDGVPLNNGKPVWGTSEDWEQKLWGNYGALAESIGLQWAGHWTHHHELPHVQMPGVNWRDLIRAKD